MEELELNSQDTAERLVFLSDQTGHLLELLHEALPPELLAQLHVLIESLSEIVAVLQYVQELAQIVLADVPEELPTNLMNRLNEQQLNY